MKFKYMKSTLTAHLIILGTGGFSNIAHAGAIVDGSCYMQTKEAIISSSCKNDDTSCKKDESACAIKGYSQLVSGVSKTGGQTGGRADFQNFMAIEKGKTSLLKKGLIWFTQSEKLKPGKLKMQNIAAAPCVNPFEPCGGGIGMPPEALGVAINMAGKVQVFDVDVLPPVCDGCSGTFIYRKLEIKYVDMIEIDFGEECNSLMTPDGLSPPC